MSKYISNILVPVLFFLQSTSQIPKHLFNGSSLEEYDPKSFSSNTKSLNQRIGTYHFGESEGEWDLVVLQLHDSLIIQVWTGSWSKNYYSKRDVWLLKCRTYNTVKVNANRFQFGKYLGQFADYKANNKTIRSVLLFADPTEDRNYEKDSAQVGFYSTNINTTYGDKDYYVLSLTVLPDSYFEEKSKEELKIMRNAIYAKYGLIFQPGGEMEKYFRQKEWYNPYQKDVSDCLTEIEKKNIQTIIKFEQ